DVRRLRARDLANGLAGHRRDVVEIFARAWCDPLAADEVVITLRERRFGRGHEFRLVHGLLPCVVLHYSPSALAHLRRAFAPSRLGKMISRGDVKVSPDAAGRMRQLSQSCDSLRRLRSNIRKGWRTERRPGGSMRAEIEALELAVE